MPYSSKTNWQHDEVVTEQDLNRIEQGIANATAVAEGAETPTGAQAKVDAHSGGTTVHGATSLATAGRIVLRDTNGRAKVAAPSAADDIARKDTVDAVQANVTTHQNATAVGIHGSAVAATANTLVHRDAAGRAKVAAPSAADDIARKDTVDAVQTNLTTHQNTTASGVHGSTSAVTANTLIHRDANGRAKVAAPSAADDIARKDTVDGLKAAANTFTQRQTFAGGIQDGDSNQDVSLIRSVQHQVHSRRTSLIYTNGTLTRVEEQDGTTVVKARALSYAEGRLDTVSDTAGGVTVTRRLVYDGSGHLTGVEPV